METCGTLFTRNDFKDESGCLKPNGHLGPHVCKTNTGELMAYDYDWDCGCADCCTDDFSDMCMVYWEVKTIAEAG